MEFDLSKPQKLLQKSARELFVRACPAKRVRELMATDTAWHPELWSAVADQGWLGIHLPESCGGLGLGTVELAVVAEEMGRACFPGPFLGTIWAATLIAEASPKSKYLEALATGQSKAAVALVEPEASWDPADVRLKATKAPDGFKISGRKSFVSDAGVADLIVCVARAGDELALLTVGAKSSGVTITATPGLDQTRKLYDVQFENVTVAAEDVLAAGDAARSALVRSMQVGTLAVCGDMLGGMQWIIEDTVEYAKTRQQFGRVIGSFQAVQQMCADMLLWTESSRSAIYFAAWALDAAPADAARVVATAKAYASDASREVANRGVQVHGGIGFTWEHDLQLLYKRSKTSEIMFGDASHHRAQLADLVFDA
ncbi:MAG TPA: acyl-CoA dehydrogenase family protein [Pirellulales bacterium]|nr:acyl-CoA dehydrogenase family protein [Pirellulales bacterium]